ncbi:hypothetical protein [[Flexibacter] sp. ATCC 35208]|uniref:hypothetical protein n=1 Tax=[Flexibacter] sp. ATCC 35208 TaxID=1936242 RepID=UPI0009CEC29B|nr:hypothetical protein [[Flexibacter] sp. ATCC 35208]OMP75794.1 hypothetical protein BW716_28205 [[Flexibacter] sp. ATCC 35208]
MTQEQLPFDFIREVQKDSNFAALFPEEQAMRAMLWIYGKMMTGAIPGERFNEEMIYTAFQETNRGQYERVPASKFNALISGLQYYFLRYDEDEQIYTFRDYAKNIFNAVLTTLNGSFNPTEIEIICTKLYEDLVQCGSTKELESWMHLNFSAFEPKMNTQVDNLDRYIDKTVRAIRETAQLQEGDALETLKNINVELEKVREYNLELRAAFSLMKEINRELNKHINGIENAELLDNIEKVRQYFPHVKYRLDLIDKKLDRLQPRMRQLFSGLNKPLFNTKVEKFLRFILVNAHLEQKNIVFPLGITSFRIFQQTPNFILVERKDDLFPPMARKRPGNDQSEEHVQEIHKGLNKKIVLQSQIDKHVQAILDKCRRDGEVLFSSYFFQIIEEENSFELAVRVAHRLVRQIPYRKDFNFVVDNSIPIQINGITIWEMIIMNCR